MASWELDFWGRVRSLKDAALQNYLASDAAARAATLSLITQVADGYLTLRELDERLALTRATIASRAESLRIFKRRFEVGAISRLDLTQVETLWQQATALGADLEQSRARRPRAGAAGGRPAGAASGRRAAGRRRRHARPAGGTAVRPAGQPPRHRRGRAPSKSRQRQHRRRPRRLLPSITLTGARHRQRRAGRPVRQRQPRLELRAEAEPADLRRRPPLRRAGPGRDAPRPGRGRLRKPSRALSATCPTRCRRATGWPSRWRCCAPPSPRRASAPGWPAALRPRRLALPGGAGRATRPAGRAAEAGADAARCCPAALACTPRWAAARARPPRQKRPPHPPMPPRPRRFATNKPEGSPPMRIPAKKLLPALLVVAVAGAGYLGWRLLGDHGPAQALSAATAASKPPRSMSPPNCPAACRTCWSRKATLSPPATAGAHAGRYPVGPARRGRGPAARDQRRGQRRRPDRAA